MEIDDAQFQQYKEAHTLLARMYGNKETKRDLERLAKKVNPNAVTTDDMAEPYLAPLKDEIKELREFKASIEKMQSDYHEQSAFGRLKEAGYTDTGVEEIKKLMEERKINDPEVAAAYWDKTRPAEPVAPNGISPSMWNFEGNLGSDADDAKLLFTNDDAWLDRKTAGFKFNNNGR